MPLPPKGFVDRNEGWGVKGGIVNTSIHDTGEWPIIPKHKREPEIHLDGIFTPGFVEDEPVFEDGEL